jgi:hypothetical protein
MRPEEILAKAEALTARLERLEKRNDSAPATCQSDKFEPLAKVSATLADIQARVAALEEAWR